MFDIFAKLLSSVASFLFPLFASYKAIKTSDPAQLKPWLMYWVVLACALLVESWAEWFLVWIPFYAYIRLLFFLYLILPQTQGARVIYTAHIHPYLEQNEAQIEELIATTHDKMKAAGIAYLKRAIEVLKTTVLGLPPDPNAAAAEAEVPAAQQPRSYTQALLARFQLPEARKNGGTGTGGAAYAGQEFYNLLAGAVSAASAAVSHATASSAATTTAGGPSSKTDMTASGALIPPDIRGTSEKMSFITAQRERLSIVLSALDREAAQLQSSEKAGSDSPSEEEEPAQRPASGLSKSRSEADFEKIEAESGAEDVDDGSGSRKGTPAATSGSGGWLPWGWGSSASPGAGTAVEGHSKVE
ncbi:Protein YOP1 [Pleurostoma richardsiae]|uniref:Protein YOP1 n=1 Tax=Pleurostoma richardsiae TaxID=41990 RepID=A0AA38RLW0_9PEZI|nr:Protein YOP1 [Pleurostoma richardsiae]